jgi:hypothetical protein
MLIKPEFIYKFLRPKLFQIYVSSYKDHKCLNECWYLNSSLGSYKYIENNDTDNSELKCEVKIAWEIFC